MFIKHLFGCKEIWKATASKNKRQDTTLNKYLNFVDYIIQEIKKKQNHCIFTLQIIHYLRKIQISFNAFL